MKGLTVRLEPLVPASEALTSWRRVWHVGGQRVERTGGRVDGARRLSSPPSSTSTAAAAAYSTELACNTHSQGCTIHTAVIFF